jgi:hypothetical protein
MTWIICATLLGLAGVYFAIVRPILEAKPQFKSFYDEADTFWKKVWAFSYKSATVLLSYIQGLLGILATQLDSIAALLGDPDFKTQVSNMLGAEPKTLGYVMLAMSLIMFAARMRSISSKE